MTERTEVSVVTQRGVTVRADLYLPGDGTSDPVPLLVAASPYQKELRDLPVHPAFPIRESGPIKFYVAHGYAYLWMDVPGSGRSEGEWDPVSRVEGEAIADVIEWAAAQDWCTGAVGMVGQSYFSWSQWNVARIAPPHLRTIVAFDGGSDLYRDWMYKGGIPDLGFGTTWGASLLLQHQATGHDIDGGSRAAFLSNMYTHQFDDAWHRDRAAFWDLDRVTIPVLSIGNWAKGPLHLRGNVESFRRAGGPKRLVILPARSPYEVQQLFASEAYHEAEILPWYDRFLKDGQHEPPPGPVVRVWVNRAGRYREANDWPPPGASTVTFALSGCQSDAVTSLNSGTLEVPAGDDAGRSGAGPAATSWSYPDPDWRIGTSAIGPGGAPDHVSRVTTFTSPPFTHDREFTGDGVLVLFASTDQADFDVVARLWVVRPGEGPFGTRTERVTQGWLRASHRGEIAELSTALRPFQRHDAPEEVEPGRVYELRVPLLPMSFVVAQGERLHLDISNGDSPMLEGRWFQWYGLKVGTDTYHHSPTYPSRLLLAEHPCPDPSPRNES